MPVPQLSMREANRQCSRAGGSCQLIPYSAGRAWNCLSVPVRRPDAACATSAKGMRHRILVVDGSPSELSSISSVLEFAGYDVDRAGDASQALAIANEVIPALILIDIATPDLDGIALIRRLKSDARLTDVSIVALSATAEQADSEKAREAGSRGYIAKPIDNQELPRQVAAFLPSGTSTVLIVDDHPKHLDLLRVQLESHGHTVLAAHNGVEALEILEGEGARVSGIVSDILMPQMDGYSLCLEVRKSKRYGGLPFILYSGTHNSEEDRQLARSVGADAYIEKPATIETILTGLESATGKHRLQVVAETLPLIQTPVLKQYSESLVRRLEDKSAELGRACDELAQTEARLSGMVDAALDAIVTIDDSHNVVLFNPAAEKMFGYSKEEALGQSLDTFIPQRFRTMHRQQIQMFGNTDLKARSIGLRTVWGLRRDGTEIAIESSFSKLETAQGRLYTVFLRDITERIRVEQALARSEAALRQAQQLAKLTHFVTGPGGALEDSAGTLAEFIGADASQMPGSIRSWLQLVHPNDRARVRALAVHAARAPVRTDAEYRLRHGTSWIHVHHVMAPLPTPDDGVVHQLWWFHTLQDISARKEDTFRIRRLNRVLSVLTAINALTTRTTDRGELLQETCRIIVEAGHFPKAWIGLVDDAGQLQFVAGYGATEAFYRSLKLMLGDGSRNDSNFASRALTELRPVVVNDLQGRPNVLSDVVETGSRAIAVLPLMIEGKGVGVLSMHAEVAGFFDEEEMKVLRDLAADISYALAHLRNSEHIQYLANYDGLTGLPNRGLFSERLLQAMQKQDANDAILAVILIDLERFRRINEIVGRAAGDELLQLVARRLQQVNGTVARIGVDVFAVEVHAEHSITEVARAFDEVVTRCLEEPFCVADQELRIGCRGGIAVFPGDGADPETLLSSAEMALRRAKIATEPYVFYAPDLNARAAEALNLESRLRRAVDRDEFVLYYQPKVTLFDRRISGVEALIRWQDPDNGLVAPGQFIPMLEECGLIDVVGRWALRQALLDQAKWRAAGLPAPRVAVNVSALQLRREDFAQVVGAIVQSNEAASLELEITESMIMERVDRSIGALKQIQAQGVSVAIDDFGTGYCSLSYLAKLPVNCLKIDRTFIVEMAEGPDGLAIVSSIIALAHSLKLKVVAEGVETEEQERILRSLSCDEAQGYLFSGPVHYEAMEALLRGAGVLSPQKVQRM